MNNSIFFLRIYDFFHNCLVSVFILHKLMLILTLCMFFTWLICSLSQTFNKVFLIIREFLNCTLCFHFCDTNPHFPTNLELGVVNQLSMEPNAFFISIFHIILTCAFSKVIHMVEIAETWKEWNSNIYNKIIHTL
jgi:hypothetical protein